MLHTRHQQQSNFKEILKRYLHFKSYEKLLNSTLRFAADL